MAPYPPHNEKQTGNPDYKVKPMEPRFERIVFVPLFAEFLSHVSETQAPRKRTKESVDDEAREVHFRHAGRKGNECSNDRQQSAREDDHLASSRKPSVRHVEVVSRNQNISAIFFDDGPSAIHSNPIRYKRTKHAADRARDRYCPQLESSR